MVFGEGSFDETDPVFAGFLFFLGGENLNYFAVLDVSVERDHPTVDLGADRGVTDFAVDSIREVDGCGFLGEFDDVTLGSEGEYMVFEEVDF